MKIGSDINAGSMEIDPFKNVLANFCFALAAGWVFLCHTYLGYLVAGLFTFERSASARVGEILEIF
jgi:hypothetical protein